MTVPAGVTGTKELLELRDMMSRYRRARCEAWSMVEGEVQHCDGENHLEDCPVEIAWQDVLAAHNVLDPNLEHGLVPEDRR